jgi:hypothetical protein
VIVAHRLSTVEIADRMLVLEDGQVVQQGFTGGVGWANRRSLRHPAPGLGGATGLRSSMVLFSDPDD